MPFVIIEFGQLEETIGEQLEEKMVIEKYLLKKIFITWLGKRHPWAFHIRVCVCIKVGREAVRLLGWGVSEFHWIRGNVKVSFYLGTERM